MNPNQSIDIPQNQIIEQENNQNINLNHYLNEKDPP